MSGPRCDRMLAGTALAMLLAAPFDLFAQEAAKSPEIPSPALATADPAATPGVIAVPAAPATPGAPTTTTEEAPAPDPLASLDPAERPFAEKIRDLLAASAGPDKIFASKNERAAVEAFYRGRAFAPLWHDKGVENARGKAVIARVKLADADGLDAGDYRIPKFDGLAPDALAEADVKLTQTVLTVARHLQAGRFPYTRVSPRNFQLPQLPPDPAAVLAAMASAEDAGQALDAYAPPHEPYRKLKEKLAELRAKASAKVEIADGPVLKNNPKAPMQDARVPSLRERLGIAGEASDQTYDAKLAAAVRAFQQSNELPATGSLDAHTVKALNAPPSSRQLDLIIANMERWRWYPRDLGTAYSIVNQPDFTLKVMQNGAQVWTTKVVVGDPAPGKQTPLLSETMKSITINPTWNVPPSIVYGEYLPALQRDPTVLARMGLVVSYGRDGSVVNQREVHVRARRARVQSWLRAHSRPREICRRPSQHCASERALERGKGHAHVRGRRAGPAAAAWVDLGAYHLSKRLRRRCRQAAAPARRLRGRQPHHRRDQDRARHHRGHSREQEGAGGCLHARHAQGGRRSARHVVLPVAFLWWKTGSTAAAVAQRVPLIPRGASHRGIART